MPENYTLENLPRPNDSSIKMMKIIEAHESNVPEETYPEIGVTQFQFNSNIN